MNSIDARQVSLRFTGTYCLVCGREWGPNFHKCCGDNSLVGVQRHGFLRKRIEYFDLDGTPIQAAELPARREQAGRTATRERRDGHQEGDAQGVPNALSHLPATFEPIGRESSELSCTSCGCKSRPDRVQDQVYCSNCGAPSAPHAQDSWEKLEPSSAPPSRSLFSAALDPVARRIYIFGGRQRRLMPSQSTIKTEPAVIIIGGYGPFIAPRFPSDNCMDDLWAFSTEKGSWEEVMSGCGCGRRCGHSAFWDPEAGQMYIVGGLAEGRACSDVWAYILDGRSWSLIGHYAGVGPCSWESAAWDSGARKVYLVQSWQQRHQIATGIPNPWGNTRGRSSRSENSGAGWIEDVVKLYVGPPDGGPWEKLKVSVRLPGLLHAACATGPPRALFLSGGQTLWIYTIGEDSWRTVGFAEIDPGDWQIGCAAWDGERERLYMLLCSTRARATQLWDYSLRGHSCRLLNLSGSCPAHHESFAAVWDDVERRLFVFGSSSDGDGIINVWSYRTAG